MRWAVAGNERCDAMAINIGYLTANRTSAGDEVYTPYYAVEPLLEFLPKDKVIWCPFDEVWSAYYNCFTENGYTVVRSSLSEGRDFFKYEPDNWDILVSNPPFSKKDEVLKRAFSFEKPFALLLPVNSIQGKSGIRYSEIRYSSLPLMQEWIIIPERIWNVPPKAIISARHTFAVTYSPQNLN